MTGFIEIQADFFVELYDLILIFFCLNPLVSTLSFSKQKIIKHTKENLLNNILNMLFMLVLKNK